MDWTSVGGYGKQCGEWRCAAIRTLINGNTTWRYALYHGYETHGVHASLEAVDKYVQEWEMAHGGLELADERDASPQSTESDAETRGACRSGGTPEQPQRALAFKQTLDPS